MIRHDWTVAEIRAIHDLPLPQLMLRAQTAHHAHHPPEEVQLCSLLSVKTGGCPEDCAYCPQSSRYDTEVGAERMLNGTRCWRPPRARARPGATRFCMGAAWREVKDGPAFESVLEMVRGVRGLGMEACVTLGHAERAAGPAGWPRPGLTAYNHNLDTSREFYGSIITTRTYEDRLRTLGNVRRAGHHGLLRAASSAWASRWATAARCWRPWPTSIPHPESVPINALVPSPGTPLADRPPVDPVELVRMIASARIVMPASKVRLSAGRLELSREAQLLCLLAGANSIFYGEKLLTTGNPDTAADQALLRDAGMRAAPRLARVVAPRLRARRRDTLAAVYRSTSTRAGRPDTDTSTAHRGTLPPGSTGSPCSASGRVIPGARKRAGSGPSGCGSGKIGRLWATWASPRRGALRSWPSRSGWRRVRGGGSRGGCGPGRWRGG